jgi:hypothetical protein
MSNNGCNKRLEMFLLESVVTTANNSLCLIQDSCSINVKLLLNYFFASTHTTFLRSKIYIYHSDINLLPVSKTMISSSGRLYINVST